MVNPGAGECRLAPGLTTAGRKTDRIWIEEKKPGGEGEGEGEGKTAEAAAGL